jgi:hypothetical protein
VTKQPGVSPPYILSATTIHNLAAKQPTSVFPPYNSSKLQTVASAKAFFGEAVEEAAAPPPKPARSAAKPTSVAQRPSESRAPQPQPAPAAALPHPFGLVPPLAQRFLLLRLGLQLRRTET